MSALATPPQERPPRLRTDPSGSWRAWPLRDRVLLGLCWAAGLALIAIAALIVLYMLVKGVQYLRPELLWDRPEASIDQSRSGGFLDPILGTVLIVVGALVIAAPLGVATAVWLTEYGKPKWLARMVESGIEVIAGTPSIVLALFGLAFFAQGGLGFLSATGEGGAVFGRSLLICCAVLSLEALPLIVGATREGLLSTPRHVREASYALGKTRAATIHRVLLPVARPNIATGCALGMGRVAGDTAVVLLLGGGTLQLTTNGSIPGLNYLQGTGSTLTTYVYANSPSGEGGAPEKAYAAAFLLLALVLVLNWAVDRIARGSNERLGWTR
ncbi:phosphate ABC transporter permease PstA [Solirubrobacter sp. CPCC 204708]|uniref:Phosphate transport system permease protein PstA n=1 Tax=Solirubrobacter deserti TaxID=2282478 RepID=A0ABT4RTW5_9ACTN|nr:phosphate ABC transporter permease PstA [Solirubrobacter deserti]MBE2320032.1 phosphate ABC transporter permease PstA [Solirubrobacter deserti]MDA0141976.1 phosphate ABC transporter permease PstA [Solirubrobacter deserti]